MHGYKPTFLQPCLTQFRILHFPDSILSYFPLQFYLTLALLISHRFLHIAIAIAIAIAITIAIAIAITITFIITIYEIPVAGILISG